jgi:aminopeptidase N
VVADPGAENLFVRSVYDKGAMTLQALREKIGDRSFFALLKAWYVVHRDGDASTADFIALAEKISRQKLRPFFQTWLYTASKPTTW